MGVGLLAGLPVGAGETDPAGVGLAVGVGAWIGLSVGEGVGVMEGVVDGTEPVGVGKIAEGRSQTARPGFIWLELSRTAMVGTDKEGIDEPPARYAVVPVGDT